MIQEDVTLLGKLTLTLRDSEGKVKDQRNLDNLIVQVGKNFLAAAVIAASVSPFNNIAVGTSGVAPTLADTTLGAEIGRVAFGTSSTNLNVATMSTTFAAGVATGALQEAGIFNSGAGGVMLSHVTFAVVNKAASDSLVITWTITAG